LYYLNRIVIESEALNTIKLLTITLTLNLILRLTRIITRKIGDTVEKKVANANFKTSPNTNTNTNQDYYEEDRGHCREGGINRYVKLPPKSQYFVPFIKRSY
jgi:hypothetical protein